MLSPDEDEWMQQGYSGVIAETSAAKWQRERKTRRHRRRGIGPPLFHLATDITNRFPLELIDRILDHLHSDIHTLSSCSLVCKGWLASSRYQLFGNAAVRLKERKGVTAKSIITQFLQLLDAPGSIGGYIRHLEICCFETSLVKNILQFTGFISIASLHIRVCNDAILAVTTFLAQNFQTLTTLKLSFIGLPFAHFLGMVGALPLLQHMGLECVTFLDEDSSVPGNQRPLSHLRELDLDLCRDFSGLLDWLLSYEQIPAISKLKFRSITRTNIVGQFLYAVGPALEHLFLCNTTYHLRIDLSQSHHLRTIQFEHIIVHRRSDSASLQWVTELLSQIISRHMEVIGFRMELDALLQLDWETLTQVFARPQFAGVRRMEFVVASSRRVATALIKERLSKYDSSGIVHVTGPKSGRNWS